MLLGRRFLTVEFFRGGSALRTKRISRTPVPLAQNSLFFKPQWLILELFAGLRLTPLSGVSLWNALPAHGVCVSLWLTRVRFCDCMDCGPALCPWHSPDEDTGVGCHLLLRGLFPAQGSNPGLLRYRQTRY